MSKIAWLQKLNFVSRFAVMFHWSIFLSSCRYHAVLITESFVVTFKIRMYESSNFVLHFKVVWATFILFHTTAFESPVPSKLKVFFSKKGKNNSASEEKADKGNEYSNIMVFFEDGHGYMGVLFIFPFVYVWKVSIWNSYFSSKKEYRLWSKTVLEFYPCDLFVKWTLLY